MPRVSLAPQETRRPWLFLSVCLSMAVLSLASQTSQSDVVKLTTTEVLGVHKPAGIKSPADSIQSKTLASSDDVVLERPHVPVSTVAILTFLMAAATGLGAVPFFFFSLAPAWQGICNGIACGVMLAASFDLVAEGQIHGGGECVVLGILLGGLFILVSQKVLESFGDVKMMELKGADARKMCLIIAIMTLHSFGEGSGVGVSFAGPTGYIQGLLVTIAIAIHNIPEGLAVAMVMASRGVPARYAMLWSIFTSLPQPLVAVPAFLCAETFSQFLPICMGFAAGCMIWMVFGEVMPDSLKESDASHVASAATISVALMVGVSSLLKGLDGLPKWERFGPALYALLFVLGPFFGGLLVVLLKRTVSLHSTLLAGLSGGVMLALAIWHPLQLLINGKMSFLAIMALLYTGAFVYLGLARLAKGRTANMKSFAGEILLMEKNFWVSPLTMAAFLACGAVMCHTLSEGLMLGVAAPHAEGLGMYMLVPVSLHGLPRGIAVSSAMYGANKSGSSALMASALTGLAGPVGAWGAMVAGLDYRGLDYWMVLACGSLFPAAGTGLLSRSVGVDRKRTWLGIILGVIFVLVGFSGTRLLCLNTSYCNSAPEAVT